MPAGSEFLDMITPQYIADLVAWGAIGARTTESQVHRELASGLSCPVGFKNGTDGNIKIAVDAIRAAQRRTISCRSPRAAIRAIVATAGNEDCHIILRGGKAAELRRRRASMPRAKELADAGTRRAHDDRLQPRQQQQECRRSRSTSVATSPRQVAAGDARIFGVMVESHLKAGRQDLVPGKAAGLRPEHHRRLHRLGRQRAP